MHNEADTCRKYILPKLIEAGWDNDPHSFTEQKTFTDGRIVVAGSKVSRRPQKRADYLLRYTRDFSIAVVEAKPNTKRRVKAFSRCRESVPKYNLGVKHEKMVETRIDSCF